MLKMEWSEVRWSFRVINCARSVRQKAAGLGVYFKATMPHL